jgi:hypothetical protein
MTDGDASTPGEEHHHATHPEGTAPFLPAAWWELPVHRRRQVAALLVLVVVVGVGFLVLRSLGGSDGTPAADPGTTTTTIDAAAFVAALPPERVQTWNSIAECESSGDWSDDTGNGFYGGLQFTLESWETVGGSGNPAQASKDEQIMRAQMLEQLQGWVAWPDCAAQLGLT